MIKIRLTRGGAKKNPFYRIVAIEDSKSRGGKALDIIGHWHPKKNSIKVSKEKLQKWLDRGAKTTDAVKKLISK